MVDQCLETHAEIEIFNLRRNKSYTSENHISNFYASEYCRIEKNSFNSFPIIVYYSHCGRTMKNENEAKPYS